METEREKGEVRTVKTKVRLFRAEDVIWMVLKNHERNNEWMDVQIGTNGFVLDLLVGVDESGHPFVRKLGSEWKAVAAELGFDVCEYVLNQDGTPCVLLYDTEEINDSRETTTRP